MRSKSRLSSRVALRPNSRTLEHKTKAARQEVRVYFTVLVELAGVARVRDSIIIVDCVWM